MYLSSLKQYVGNWLKYYLILVDTEYLRACYFYKVLLESNSLSACHQTDMSCFQGLFFCPEAFSLLLHNFCIYHISPPGHEVGSLIA